MLDISNDDGIRKCARTKAPVFVRLYSNDWFTGTVGLKADQRGVLMTMCVYIWNTGRRVPLDDAEASRMMCLNFKTYVRVRNQLLALGKVEKHEDGYGNNRAEAEFEAARDGQATRRNSEHDTEGKARDQAPSPRAVTHAETRNPVLNAANNLGADVPIDRPIDRGIDVPIEVKNSEQNQWPSIDLRLKTKEAVQKEAALPVDLKVLSERVTAACNGALASEAVAPGLASMATPLRWIESGCDLERDVLPALTVAGKKYHGKQIRSWEYFTAMIAEARQRREAGMPAPAISAVRNRKPTLAEQEAFIRDRQRAVFETYGIDTGGFFTPGDSAEIERRRKAGNGLPPMFNQTQKAEPAQTVPGGVDR